MPTAPAPVPNPAAPGNAGDILAQMAARNPAVAAALARVGTGGASQGVSLYGNPTSYADPTSPVYTGYNRVNPTYTVPGKWGFPITGSMYDRGQAVDTHSTVDDTLKSFYNMSPDDLARTQRVLFAGGFYASGTHLTDIAFGTPDEQSFSAWARAVSRAARLYGAGQKVTVDGVIEQAARAGGITAGATTKKDKVVNLTDPAALRATIDNTSQTILGRKATPDEERVFVSLIHQTQASAQLAVQNTNNPYAGGVLDSSSGPDVQPTSYNVSTNAQGAPDVAMSDLTSAQQASQQPGGIVTSTTPNPDAQAAEYLRTQNPEEAGAHDIALQFLNFAKALRGPMG